MKLFKLFITLFFTALLFSGCDYSPKFPIAPELTAITAVKPIVGYGETIEITATAQDANGDALIYTWSCTEGTLLNSGLATTLWEAPHFDTTATIHVYVTDGVTHLGDLGSIEIQVAPAMLDEDFSWRRCFGGAGTDKMTTNSFVPTPDGGAVLLGSSTDNSIGGLDFIVLKLNDTGDIEWQKTFGGTSHDIPAAVDVTAEGEIILGGSTYSFGQGSFDWWVLKLNASGDILWQKSYGTTADERLATVKALDNGHIVLAGNVQGLWIGSWDALVFEVTGDGEPVEGSINAFGGLLDDYITSLAIMADGSLLVGGNATSFSATIEPDWWIFRLKNNEILWHCKPDSSDKNFLTSIGISSDGGFIATGYREYLENLEIKSEIITRKFDVTGNTLWEMSLRLGSQSRANAVLETDDGGILLGGMTNGAGLQKEDMWLMKLQGTGSIEWQRSFGSSNGEEIFNIIKTPKNHYRVAGNTRSFGKGDQDLWVFDVDNKGFSEAPGAYTFIKPKEVISAADSTKPITISHLNKDAFITIETLSEAKNLNIEVTNVE